MVHLFKELQPTDHFQITLPNVLSTNERQMLTLFYQPLTGAEPISLYLTLWAEGEHSDDQMTHYYLMNVLSMPIKEIFEARIALEAIGLLRTYRKQKGDTREFIYELVQPLDAQRFFEDPLLSMFLYSKIGEYPYRKLRQRFLKNVDMQDFEEVSRSFIDVYKPVHTNVPNDSFTTKKSKKREYPFYYEQFDFELLKAGLSEQLVPASSLTTEVRELISKLAFLYMLSPIDMQKVVIMALDENTVVTSERLKRAAADYYKLTISREAPKLSKTFEQDVILTNAPTEKMTREQERLHYYETTPPIQVLRDTNNGIEPIPASVQLAEDLLVLYKMPIGVVNVLLEYTMLTTDMKLPRKYVEQIADHWMRKNLQTAKEAMDLARAERDKYNKWKTESENPVTTTPKRNYTRGGKIEKVPEWFKNRQKAGEKKQEVKPAAEDFEQQRQQLLEKLGKLK
jgi:replication initiation and membrane attachment protein